MLSDPNNEDTTIRVGVFGKRDLAYMQSLSAAIVQRSPRNLMLVIFLILLFVLCALLWMSWASIDVVIRGSGKVIPAGQVQLIQSLEGGVVSEILIVEGDTVEENQPLVKISDIAFAGSFEENRLLYFELLAKSSRLTAEAFGQAFEPNEEVNKNAPKLNISEENLYRSNKQQLSDTLNILEEQIRQQESALLETHSKKRQLEKSSNLMQQEIRIKEPLKNKGIISEVEFIQLLQREAELDGELESIKLSIPRIQSTIEEARFKKQKELLDFKNKAKKELNEINAEISRVKEAQSALQDRVRRTTLRSPVKGIVKSLHTNTIGGVVSPGSKVVEIVPQDGDLLVELKIKPADIASVSVGQPARLKFSAYDFAIHGSLQGEVMFVSADTITNEEGESYFLVRVKPKKSYLGPSAQLLPVKVGMNAEADIITAKKTILQYLIQPVSRGFSKALREQ
jgi:adhesin transport system membrane fusion protein